MEHEEGRGKRYPLPATPGKVVGTSRCALAAHPATSGAAVKPPHAGLKFRGLVNRRDLPHDFLQRLGVRGNEEGRGELHTLPATPGKVVGTSAPSHAGPPPFRYLIRRNAPRSLRYCLR